MASTLLERLLAAFQASPGTELDLSFRLSEPDWSALADGADGLRTVVTLRVGTQAVPGSVVVRFAARLPNLRHLKAIALSDDDLSLIAHNLFELTSLDLTECHQVTDTGVKALAKLSALTSLNLTGCHQVTDTGVKALAKLSALTSLDLTWCSQVTDTGVMALADKLHSLTSLGLGGCERVTEAGVKALAKLTALTSLNLNLCAGVTGAGVTALAKLTALTSLSLYGCDGVTDAVVKILADKLVGLVFFDVRDIPALRAPQELLRNSHGPAIRAFYMRGGKEGKQQLNEAKLIVVGNEAVGKSALVNFLAFDTPCSDTVKTEGVNILDRINVAKWDVERTEDGDGPLRLNVWDFGGQEVLYETHKFFLTARSLYLIVLEARRENTGDGESRLHDWMRAVRNRGGADVPVVVVVNKAEDPHDLRLDEPRLMREYPSIRAVVVVNKAEDPHDLRLDEPRLMREYPSIRAFVRTSCRDPKTFPDGGKGVAALRKRIVDLVRNDPALQHVRDWFPLSYFNVKEEVGQLARDESMLTTARYTTICNAAGLTTEVEQDPLLALLDDIGVVVRHSEATLLDPNWLTTAVYRILTHSAVVQAGGEFAVDWVGRLLADLPSVRKYPKASWPYIANMMSRFNLSFELADRRGHYLVPLQLPAQEPELNWDEMNSLRFRYDYDNLPLGLLPRFIVEMHRHLTPKRTAWVSGVVLDVDGCRVLARADRKNRRVLVFVSGSNNQRRGALAVVRTAFATVHAIHADLAIKPMVPVDVPGNPDAAIEYELLLAAESQGVKQLPVVGATKPLPVKNLLDGIGREPSPRKPKVGESGLQIYGPVYNPVFSPNVVGEITMGDLNKATMSNSPGSAQAVGRSTATATENVIQLGNLEPAAAAQVATLLGELLALLRGLEVTTEMKPKLDETADTVLEAKDVAASAAPDKGKLKAAWDTVQGWVGGALSVGMFAADAAAKVKDLVKRLGGLLG